MTTDPGVIDLANFETCKRGELCSGGWNLQTIPPIPHCIDCCLEDCPTAKAERDRIEHTEPVKSVFETELLDDL